jgi:hypothetical protein
MRKLVLAVAAAAVLMPAPAFAWGFVAHQLIMKRAIDLLPPELAPFYQHFRSDIEMRVVDPDLWRKVAPEDEPNHFLDLGIPEYGPPPFAGLPRERGQATEKFGVVTLRKYGMLPWRVEEISGNLRRAFEAMAGREAFATSDVTLFSSFLAHYIQDAFQPFHATDNFDGQKTGNAGIHARFETELTVRFQSRLRLSPAPARGLKSHRDAAFDALATSYAQIDRILAADKAAIGGKELYDDEYFEHFFLAVQPVLEERLSAAITATAGAILGAWEQAGRPALYTELPRTPERVRR